MSLNVRACAIARVVNGAPATHPPTAAPPARTRSALPSPCAGSAALTLHCRVPGQPGERLTAFLDKLVGSKKFLERALAERSMTVDDSSADPFSVHCLVASGSMGPGFILVLAITAKSYPRRLIFPPPVGDAESGPEGLLAQLAAELLRECGPSMLAVEVAAATGLQRAHLGGRVTQLMERVCATYEDTASKDKLRSLQSDVDSVHGVMQDNVNAMLRNHDQLDDLRGKLSTTTDAAKQFYGATLSERRMQQCREYKLQLMVAGAATLVCFVFVLPWFSWFVSGDGGDEGEGAAPTPLPTPPPME